MTMNLPILDSADELPLICRAMNHRDRVAIRTDEKEWTYEELLKRSADLAMELLGESDDLAEARVAYMAPAGFDYFVIQWAIWRAGGVAVPLSSSATAPELRHVLSDCAVDRLVVTPQYADHMSEMSGEFHLPLVTLGESETGEGCELPSVQEDRRALILYTSGTTNKPKGVVTTHANLRAQITSLVEAWSWEADDRIPLFLPMHHVHGIVNIGCCALWSGALVETFAGFHLETLLKRVSEGAYSVFMAVPTIYVKLIEGLKEGVIEAERREKILAGFAAMRLMVSGSAALPPSVHETWTGLMGQNLLERYGMTETGMMISNPYDGERRPGAVGFALPFVEIRLKAEGGKVIEEEEAPGEIQVKGPIVFHEYWGLPEVTEASFDDGWFCTGDMAVIEDGYYRIMGRLSIDIIKSGGYKLSALEIEAVLLEHPAIRECAVVGVPDDTWGEAVAAAVVLEAGAGSLELSDLRDWARESLSRYKLPSRLLLVEGLPRNAMGKVKKKKVTALWCS